jgi:hypothetical protein
MLMAWLRGVSTGAALAVVVALLAGVLIGRLTDSSLQQDPVGPRSNENGVPVGYQHSPQGAVAAASNYLSFLNSPTILMDQDKLQGGLAKIAAPSSQNFVKETESAAQTDRQAFEQAGTTQAGPMAYENPQFGYRLTSYDQKRTRVVIWGMGMFGNASNTPPQGGFGNTALDLSWANGDWKLTNFSNEPGLVPRTGQTPTPPDQFVAQVQQFRGFRYAP